MHFSHQSYNLLLIFFFLSVYLPIIFTYQLKIIYSYQLSQIFDDKVDYKCCLKNMLRFLNSNITGGMIDERLNNPQGILFFGLLKIQIILKMKITKGNLDFLFVDILFLFFTQWKWFSLRQSSFKLITHLIKFHR